MLYLALSLEGMFAEMVHGFGHRLEPLTVCSYDVDVDDVVDLSSDDARNSAGVRLTDMACEWAYDLANGRRPASWIMTEALRTRGAAGILVPSFANGASMKALKLVLWTWDPSRRTKSMCSIQTGDFREMHPPGSTNAIGQPGRAAPTTSAPSPVI